MEPDANLAEITAISDGLYAERAETSIFDAGLTNTLPQRLESCRFEDSVRLSDKARDWVRRLTAIDGAALPTDVEDTRRYLLFEAGLLASRADLHWYDLQFSSYRFGHVVNQAHGLLEMLPVDEAADAERYLALVEQYAVFLRDTEENLREQARRGIVLHPEAVASGEAILDGVAASVHGRLRLDAARTKALPAAVSAATQQATDALLAKAVDPALASLRGYVRDVYAPGATDTDGVGLSRYAGGREAYEVLIRENTTLPLSAEDVHRLGLEIVESLEAEMAGLRARMSIRGSGEDFLARVRQDPRFLATSPKDVEGLYHGVLAQAQAALPRFFGAREITPVGFRRLSPELEASVTYGYYQPPIPGRDPKGYYMYNGSGLPQRPTIVSKSLVLHETLPGHHLHFASQTLDTRRHPARRNPYLNAFAEAWAEYAADLGFEIGVYEAPIDHYGRLLMRMFLATRLVVDTGLNAFGWSLAQARAYMSARTIASPGEIASETVRYTTWPGQSLAYAIGLLRLRAARAQAEQRLGDRFDLAAFHNLIIDGGALPIPDLEFAIARWADARAAA